MKKKEYSIYFFLTRVDYDEARGLTFQASGLRCANVRVFARDYDTAKSMFAEAFPFGVRHSVRATGKRR